MTEDSRPDGCRFRLVLGGRKPLQADIPVRMNVHERIDKLSEIEAKAALKQCIEVMAKNLHCGDCRHSELLPDGTIDKCATPWHCADMLLDDMLKETQHEHKGTN